MMSVTVSILNSSEVRLKKFGFFCTLKKRCLKRSRFFAAHFKVKVSIEITPDLD